MNSLRTIPLFPAGQIVATPGALTLLEQANQSPLEFLSRHLRGDWGDLCQDNNQRLEFVFLEHTYRWLKPGGVLVLVIPQPQLRVCARTLSEHFTDLSVYRLTDPPSGQYQQVAVFGVRRK